jgi:hypothetical protein
MDIIRLMLVGPSGDVFYENLGFSPTEVKHFDELTAGFLGEDNCIAEAEAKFFEYDKNIGRIAVEELGAELKFEGLLTPTLATPTLPGPEKMPIRNRILKPENGQAYSESAIKSHRLSKSKKVKVKGEYTRTFSPLVKPNAVLYVQARQGYELDQAAARKRTSYDIALEDTVINLAIDKPQDLPQPYVEIEAADPDPKRAKELFKSFIKGRGQVLGLYLENAYSGSLKAYYRKLGMKPVARRVWL